MYRMRWLECWSDKREPEFPSIHVEHTQQLDGWYEHVYEWNFKAKDHEDAKIKVREFIKDYPCPMEVFSVYYTNPIMTEEDV